MPPPWKALRRAVQGAAVVCVLVALWTAWSLVTARPLLHDAQDAIEAAAEAKDPAEILQLLDRAEDRLRRADHRLSGIGPLAAERVPVLGRTPHAARLVTEAAFAAVSAGHDVLTVTQRGPVLSSGRVDLAALQDLQDAVRGAAADIAPSSRRLAGVDTRWTPSAVQQGAQMVRTRLDDLPELLSDAAGGLDALGGLVGRDGTRRLLLVVENNAELRGLGGLVTVFAEATFDEGALTVGQFQDVADVADMAGDTERVPAPADYRALWGRYLADTTLWKNTNMSPDGPTASAVLAEVAAQSLPARPDAVVWFDVRTIVALLEATGPAILPDGTALTADNAVRVLLSDAYSDAEDSTAGQARRRAGLRAAADSIAGRLLGSGTPPARTAEALGRAAAGRHLVVWSARGREQDQLVAAGVAGEVSGDGADLSSFFVQNLGGGDAEGNKLDYYGRRQVTKRVVVDEDAALVEQVFTVRNTAPPSGLPRYVAGQVTPGVANLLVSAALPRGAQLQGFTRGGRLLDVEPLPSGDHLVVQDVVSLPPGAMTEWTLRYRLPVDDGAYRSTLFPQPLAVDAGLLLEVRAADGLVLRTPPGSPVDEDGVLRTTGPYEEVTSVEVTAQAKGRFRRLLDGLQRFWNEPVQLP